LCGMQCLWRPQGRLNLDAIVARSTGKENEARIMSWRERFLILGYDVACQCTDLRHRRVERVVTPSPVLEGFKLDLFQLERRDLGSVIMTAFS
jgi:hypothetical protein